MQVATVLLHYGVTLHICTNLYMNPAQYVKPVAVTSWFYQLNMRWFLAHFSNVYYLIYTPLYLCEHQPLLLYLYNFVDWCMRLNQETTLIRTIWLIDMRLNQETTLITNEWSWRSFYKILLNFFHFFPEILQGWTWLAQYFF